jgi:hypothetical protein
MKTGCFGLWGFKFWILRLLNEMLNVFLVSVFILVLFVGFIIQDYNWVLLQEISMYK